MYTNHRHYVLLIFATGAIFIAILGYAALYRTVTSQSVEAHDATQELALTDKKKQMEEDTVSIYQKTADKRAHLNNAVITSDKVVDFIKAVEQVGSDSESDLVLSSIVDEAIPSEKGMSYFKGHVEVKGLWSNVMRALVLLENMPYSISINNVRLVISSDQEGYSKQAPAWFLSLDLKVLTHK